MEVQHYNADIVDGKDAIKPSFNQVRLKLTANVDVEGVVDGFMNLNAIGGSERGKISMLYN